MAVVNEKIRAQILGGALDNNQTYLSGYFGGFYVILRPIGNEWMLSVDAVSAMDPGNVRLAEFASRLTAENKKIKRFDMDGATVRLFLKVLALKKLPEVLDECALPLFDFLRTGLYQAACSNCQQATPVKLYEVNGVPEHLCESCAEARRSGLEANQVSAKSQKSSWIPGLVGAVLGCLGGVALWIAIFYLGYIAGIAGFVMAVLALKAYEKFGGAMDVKGVIICIIVLIAGVYFANKLAWALDAYAALKEYDWTFSECFRNLNYILTESELTGAYYGDLAIGLLLTAISTVGTIVAAFRKSTGKFTFVEK